jgi:hypothetical protein
MSGNVEAVTLAADDALELGEMLEFLGDWIEFNPDRLGHWLERFTVGGYTLDELRADLARFAFVLGGDGQSFIAGGAP